MTGTLRAQWQLVLMAAQLLTRVPVTLSCAPTPGELARALRYAPLIGAGIGLAGAAVLGCGLPPALAAVLAVAAMALLTGGLHEDGLADTLDGLGGSRSPAMALEIMKDSRIGAFGALGLVLVTAGRIAALASLANEGAASAMVGVSALSRLAMLLPVALLPPARPAGLGAPVSAGPGATGWSVAALTVVLAWAGEPLLLTASAVCLGAAWLACGVFRRRLGGYTGDTLGAVQQGSELLAYCVLLWHAD